MGRDDLRYVNCASCGKELLGTETPGNVFHAMRLFDPTDLPERVAGRIHARPHCGACLRVATAGPTRGHRRASGVRDESPGQESAIRRMEDGQ